MNAARAIAFLRPASATRGGVEQVELPPAVRAISTFSRVDYVDAFLVQIGSTQARIAEQWARAILEDAPGSVRRRLRSGWLALGLRLGSSNSDRFVLGWELRRRTADHVLLGATSRIGMPAELVLERRPETLLFGTLVRHENPIARAVWAGVEPVHRPVVRHVLEQARIRATTDEIR